MWQIPSTPPTPPPPSESMSSSPGVESDSGQPLTNGDHAPGTALTNGDHAPRTDLTNESNASRSSTSPPIGRAPTPRAISSGSDEELLGALPPASLSNTEMGQIDEFVDHHLRHREVQWEALARSRGQSEPARLFRTQSSSWRYVANIEIRGVQRGFIFEAAGLSENEHG